MLPLVAHSIPRPGPPAHAVRRPGRVRLRYRSPPNNDPRTATPLLSRPTPVITAWMASEPQRQTTQRCGSPCGGPCTSRSMHRRMCSKTRSACGWRPRTTTVAGVPTWTQRALACSAWDGMIVHRVVAPALFDLRPAARLVGVARSLVGIQGRQTAGAASRSRRVAQRQPQASPKSHRHGRRSCLTPPSRNRAG